MDEELDIGENKGFNKNKSGNSSQKSGITAKQPLVLSFLLNTIFFIVGYIIFATKYSLFGIEFATSPIKGLFLLVGMLFGGYFLLLSTKSKVDGTAYITFGIMYSLYSIATQNVGSIIHVLPLIFIIAIILGVYVENMHDYFIHFTNSLQRWKEERDDLFSKLPYVKKYIDDKIKLSNSNKPTIKKPIKKETVNKGVNVNIKNEIIQEPNSDYDYRYPPEEVENTKSIKNESFLDFTGGIVDASNEDDIDNGEDTEEGVDVDSLILTNSNIIEDEYDEDEVSVKYGIKEYFEGLGFENTGNILSNFENEEVDKHYYRFV